MYQFLRRLIRDEGASTMVEIAMLMPFQIFLTYGIVETGLSIIALEEFDNAVGAAIRQIRTGALQQAPIPSTYAGATNCTNANFTPSSSQNCLGISIATGDSASTIFGKLICANNYDGNAIFKCNLTGAAYVGLNWNVTGYANWKSLSSALPTLTYNSNNTPSATFAPGAGTMVVVAMVGYKRPFTTPLIGCFFDPADCLGPTQYLLLTYNAVFQAEPWG